MTKPDYVFVAGNNCERVARGGIDNSKLNGIRTDVYRGEFQRLATS
jgi:hypothetical protein